MDVQAFRDLVTHARMWLREFEAIQGLGDGIAAAVAYKEEIEAATERLKKVYAELKEEINQERLALKSLRESIVSEKNVLQGELGAVRDQTAKETERLHSEFERKQRAYFDRIAAFDQQAAEKETAANVKLSEIHAKAQEVREQLRKLAKHLGEE